MKMIKRRCSINKDYFICPGVINHKDEIISAAGNFGTKLYISNSREDDASNGINN